MSVTVDECIKGKGSLERECLELIEIIEQNDLTFEVLKPMMLMNIAHSLAVIADAIGERKVPEKPNSSEKPNNSLDKDINVRSKERSE